MGKTTAKTTTKKPTVKTAVRANGTVKKTTTEAIKKTTAGAVKNATPRTKRPRVTKQPDAHEQIRASALKAAQYAIDKKALDVHLLDLSKITSMTDFFVVATGDSDRQVKAIAENVIAEMRDTEGISPWRSEGWDSLRWVLIDFVDFVVHVFQPEARLYYNIERLWADAPTVTIEDTALALKAPKPKASKPMAAPKKKTIAKTKSPIKIVSDFKPAEGLQH